MDGDIEKNRQTDSYLENKEVNEGKVEEKVEKVKEEAKEEVRAEETIKVDEKAEVKEEEKVIHYEHKEEVTEMKKKREEQKEERHKEEHKEEHKEVKKEESESKRTELTIEKNTLQEIKSSRQSIERVEELKESKGGEILNHVNGEQLKGSEKETHKEEKSKEKLVEPETSKETLTEENPKEVTKEKVSQEGEVRPDVTEGEKVNTTKKEAAAVVVEANSMREEEGKTPQNPQETRIDTSKTESSQSTEQPSATPGPDSPQNPPSPVSPRPGDQKEKEVILSPVPPKLDLSSRRESFTQKIKASWKDSLSIRKDKMKDKRQISNTNFGPLLPGSPHPNEDDSPTFAPSSPREKNGSLSKRIGRAVISGVNKLRGKSSKDAKDDDSSPQTGSDNNQKSDESEGSEESDPDADARDLQEPDGSGSGSFPNPKRIASLPNLSTPNSSDSPIPARRNSDPIVPLQSIIKGTRADRTSQNVKFNEIVTVRRTWAKKDYDRKGEVTWRLTPDKAIEIRNELNDFKREMDIHEESRTNTHFY